MTSCIVAGCIAYLGRPVDSALKRGASVGIAFIVVGVILSLVLYPDWVWQAVVWPFAIVGAFVGRYVVLRSSDAERSHQPPNQD